ncbi:MAG: hypothetical protein JRH13_14345 [Deltaproteobacteria bacterium]|nr:hypothetical protein [Deltaproteobacteria bacterium]MBW2017658.1 hypothetical protein [Deltaproteobacteria bacterium]MBW2130531.1 hypothetical protein [Deltaproteobacteria bacterium]MBW2303594.1 hypothetical protein [Deltaproteobacteria bacterium]
MFSIKTESLELKLEVVPVNSLLIHEEVLPNLAHKLLLEFKNWNNLQNPIIVDENHIVLDGNHRAYAFKKLRFTYIPVCKIDYFHEKAELRYWFRVLDGVKNIAVVERVAKELGGIVQEVGDKERLNEILDLNPLSCGIQKRDYCASLTFPRDTVKDAVDAYGALEKIQKRLTALGIEVRFVPCQHITEGDFSNTLKDDEVVLWTPRMTKKMVVDAAKRGRVFAPKSTRHCIPARPLNVNVPTTWFKEEVTLDEMNDRFRRFLEGKRLKRFGPGQVIEGRYYEEEVFVFYDKA